MQGVSPTGGVSNPTGGTVSASGGTTPTGAGGTTSTGGAPKTTGGTLATGGTKATGGVTATTGGLSTGGTAAGGAPIGGSGGGSAGGGASSLGGAGGTNGGGGAAGGMAAAGAGTGGRINTGPCTASKSTGANVSGSGPHKVVVETNSDPGINEGTIFRPAELGGAEKYPIFVWGNGACSRTGMSNSAAMAEIASHGYFVVADGKPNGGDPNIEMSANVVGMAKPLLAYIGWAIDENDKPCSAYYQSLDSAKIAANGFSCGGLMAAGTSSDPRITTWGTTSSGLTSPNQDFYKAVHTPVLIIEGGTSDIAYENGKRDFDNLSGLGIPVMFFSKNIGHGGDLSSSRGGDFTKINLAWLNWQLKGDETATGKGLLVGSGCSYCTNSAWEVDSDNL
jgi:hypothetical protein